MSIKKFLNQLLYFLKLPSKLHNYVTSPIVHTPKKANFTLMMKMHDHAVNKPQKVCIRETINYPDIFPESNEPEYEQNEFISIQERVAAIELVQSAISNTLDSFDKSVTTMEHILHAPQIDTARQNDNCLANLPDAGNTNSDSELKDDVCIIYIY